MKKQLGKALACLLLFPLLGGVFAVPAGAAAPAGTLDAAVSAPEKASEAAVSSDAFITESTESHAPIGADAAGAKWKTVGKHLRLQSSSGSYKKGFVKRNGKLYYFDSKGNLKVGFFTVGGKKYYASYVKGEKGKGQILTGLVKIGAYFYSLDPSSSHPGAAATGFRTINGRRYYFQSDGRMITGWFTVSGSKYYASCNKKGHLGMLLTGVQKIGSKTYRFDANGKLISQVADSNAPASGQYTHMIDVSQFQGAINFQQVKAAGVNAVIIRAGYGDNNIDPYFYANIRNAKAAGLKVGLYWFSYAYTNQMAVNEAKYVLRALGSYSLDLPIFFDWEYSSMDYAHKHGKKPGRSQITEMTGAFCNTITQSGKRAGFYFNLAYLNNYYDLSKLQRYSTWYAFWGTNKPGSNIWAHANTMSAPTRYDLWQFTSRGKISGIKGYVDCDLLLNSSLIK